MRLDVTFRELDKSRSRLTLSTSRLYPTMPEWSTTRAITRSRQNRKTRACDTPKVSSRKCKNQRNSILRGVKS